MIVSKQTLGKFFNFFSSLEASRGLQGLRLFILHTFSKLVTRQLIQTRLPGNLIQYISEFPCQMYRILLMIIGVKKFKAYRISHLQK